MSDRPNIAELAADVRRLVDAMDRSNQAAPFSEDEVARIRRAAEFVEWLDMSGRIGKWVLALLTAGVMLASQWERIAEFLRGVK